MTSMITSTSTSGGAILNSLLVDLSNAPTPQLQHQMAVEVLEQTESLNRSISAALCHQFTMDRNTLADEITQCVRMAAWKLLTQIAGQPQYLAKVRSYRAVLTARAGRAVTDLIDSVEGRSQSRGEVSLRRRLAEAARTREALIREGITNPTNEQIIERTNARMKAARSDAARQGMLLKEEDFKHTLRRSAIADYDTPAVGPEDGYDAGLYPGEAEAMIGAIMTALREADASRARAATYVTLETVGYLYFGRAAGASREMWDGPPTADFVAGQLGIPLTTAKEKIAGVRRIAQGVATRYSRMVG
jgi:hypothetical protein